MTRKRALSSDLDDGSDYEVPKPSKRTKTKVSSKNRVVVKGKGRKKAASGGGALQRLPAELILEVRSSFKSAFQTIILITLSCQR